MSEIQNKSVALVTQIEGALAHLSPSDRALSFLEKSLDLYFALGGSPDAAVELVTQTRGGARPRVEASVANVVIELAAASHLSDIDMIQAAYNRLDVELAAPRAKR
ncbi:hypothetical protein [Ensifer sp.]|jgi:hypothetical protein|uniref:hypothetical protein n=1 Tax=Ensifer sp. TaxID=1872086 RepID=UPI002E144619|nr:hypothetical protein [Ensifer sp.]